MTALESVATSRSDGDDDSNDSLDYWLRLDSIIGSIDSGDDSWAKSKLPEVVLVVASAVVIILTFLGCCGALRVIYHAKHWQIITIISIKNILPHIRRVGWLYSSTSSYCWCCPWLQWLELLLLLEGDALL